MMTAADTPSREELLDLVTDIIASGNGEVSSRVIAEQVMEALDSRLAAKPADDGVREEPEVIAARICERIWSKKYQTLRTMEKVSIAESEIVTAIKAERALSTKAPKP